MAGSARRKVKPKFFGIETPPVRSNTFGINISDEDDLVHITFAWIPPEKINEVYILNRILLGRNAARRLANDLLTYVDKTEGIGLKEKKGVS
jgi:hypothetical protein